MNGYLLLLERYELEKESISKWDKLDELFCHEEIEFHRQGMSLLSVFGSDKLCRYVEERDGQIVLKDGYAFCNRVGLEEVLLEYVLEDLDWKELYEQGMFNEMEVRFFGTVFGTVDYSSLSLLHQTKVLSYSKLMVPVVCGEFEMGALEGDEDADGDETPRHRVSISRDLLVGKYPVTQGLYESVMGKNPSRFKGSTRPVEQVSWYDAVLFCNKLSELEGREPVYTINGDDVSCNFVAKGYRLLTEAEWEYCARSGQRFKYSGSDTVDEVAWYGGNSGGETHPVGLKKPNGFGLYDMSGNVWEWVWDWYGDYSSGTQVDPQGPTSGSFRVNRGGSWSSNAQDMRVSRRSIFAPANTGDDLGFRLGLTP